MRHFKEQLKQYRDEFSKNRKFDAVFVSSIMDMTEQLQDDLEQDEKEMIGSRLQSSFRDRELTYYCHLKIIYFQRLDSTRKIKKVEHFAMLKGTNSILPEYL